jgi:alkylation response protein AidB-like acyl-CoA dehydrogenase
LTELTTELALHQPWAHDGKDLDEVLAAIAADYQRRLRDGGHEPPADGLRLVREHGLGAVRLAREHGGANYTVPEFFGFVISLAEADPDLAHILRVHYSVVEELQRVPRRPGSERWVSLVGGGKLIGGTSSELSSARVGGQSYDTKLVNHADGLRLSGRKFYSTGAQFSDYVRVSAEDENGSPVGVFIPADRHGVVHVDDWDGIGQRHTGSGTTLFEDVEVAPDEVIRLGTSVGVDRARGALVQLYLHAIAAGILRNLTSEAAALVRNRHRTYTFATTETPSTDPQLLEIVGEIDAVAYAAESLVLGAAAELASALDAARVTGIDSALEARASIAAARVKVALEEPALRAASRIFDAGGASSVRAATHLDRHWRNLRTLFSHNPTVYKARVLGDIAVNGAALPDSGFF